MATIRASSSTSMAKTEMEAAEALAGLARFPPNSPRIRSISERVKHESSNDGSNDSSTNSYQDATNFTLKKPERSGISTSKSVKDEQSTDLRLNPPTYPTNCASSGRKSRQNLTEAEMEARKIRRVLANRESARQTIHRRQAIFEELTRKAVDLAWENEKLKREKETASKQYDSLKTKNECLKAEMIKAMKVEAREELNATNEPTVSASSTNSPFIIYNQPPFLPLVWPNSVQLQCRGIVFPPHIPDSSSCEEGNSIGAAGPVYLLPYPWLVTTSLPQTQSGSGGNGHGRPHSFNLNDKPKESSSECQQQQQFFPEKVLKEGSPGFPPDGGGGGRTTGANSKVVAMAPVSCDDIDNDNCSIKEHDHVKGSSRVGDSEQIPVVWSAGKRVGDSAAADARKRRKLLTRVKSNFQYCRQLRIMH
ncbi:hypothetical protein L6452_08675 [Arctium lappa]|uniref:Uncharacterized protein n=1 Tax=Arctium lappa TaxID=4217 RepID=A0ACB9DID3_ARCLA|nr:hypothetical protein L6452_08675 [Arctium lappa]